MGNRPYPPLSLKRLKTYSLKSRPSKVKLSDFARPWQPGASFQSFLDSLPSLLAGQDFRSVVRAIAQAKKNHKTIFWAMGAHVIKVGLNPILIGLMEKGFVSALAMNGAGIIHDSELALVGRTSEDVDQELGRGTFGMARETALFLNQAISRGAGEGRGSG